MVDESFKDPEETRGDFDPEGKTHGDETVSKEWLDPNVGARGDEWIGRRIGQFEIIRIIGTGGMGNVYEAKQQHPHRSVALKIVKSAAATEVTLQRFEMESEMLARLQHPGIAQVFDSGHQIHDGTPLPYFAMEYVPGSRHITDYAQDEHLSMEGKLGLFLAVCEAVQYGHGRGVIHRDLKPSNILITNSGRPKVIDFGVAMLTGTNDPDHTITREGRFVGTFQWSSPEQCGDDPHDVDVRTDVYSLGMILYKLMTGQLPYELKGVPIYKAPTVVLESQPKPPRSINPLLPVEIEHILGKSLEKDRDSRYESVAELLLDIRRLLGNQPIHAKPPSRIRRLRLYAKRNQLKFRAGIAVLIAIMLGLTGLIWGFIESEAQQKEMKSLLLEAESARVEAEHKVYVATIGTVQAAIANHSWEMARHHLADTDRNQRGWEWQYLQGVVDQSLRQWLIGNRPVSLATSPSSNQLAISFEGGRVLLIDDSRNISRDLQVQSNIRSLAFKKDGSMLIFGLDDGQIGLLNLLDDELQYIDTLFPSIEAITTFDSGGFATGHEDGTVKVWDENHKSLIEWNTSHGMVLSLDFDEKNNRLAIGNIDGSVQVLYLGENTIPILLGSHGGAVHAVVFHQDGRIFSGGADDAIRVWDVEQKKQLDALRAHRGDVMDIAIHGDILTSAGEDGNIFVWSTDELKQLDLLKGHDDVIWSIDTLGDNRIVSIGRDGSIRWWDITSPTPDKLHVASSMPAADLTFVWNDTLVAVSEFDHGVQVIDLSSGESNNIASRSSQEISKVAFVPTTSYVVTGDVGGEVRLWNTEELRFEHLIGSCNGQISTLSVSPFGKYIAAGTFAGELCVWNRNSTDIVFQKENESAIILSTVFGQNGEVLFVTSSDGNLTAYNIPSGTSKWNLIGNGSDIVAMAFVPSMNAIITATARNVIQLLDASTGTLITTSEAAGGSLRDLALFPDSKRFATVQGDGTIGIWNLKRFGLIASFPSNQSLESICISTDGHRLAVGGGNATIQLMDSMTRSARSTNSK